ATCAEASASMTTRSSPESVATAERRRSTHVPSRISSMPAPFASRSCVAAAASSHPVMVRAATFQATSAPVSSKTAIPSCASAKRRSANGSAVIFRIRRRMGAAGRGDHPPLGGRPPGRHSPPPRYGESAPTPPFVHVKSHTRRMRLLAVLLGAALVLGGRPADAVTPPEDPEPAPSLHCVRPVATTAVENVMEAQWSPDGHTLALVWFARVPSTRSPAGYREVEVADTLDIRTGRLWPIGVGDEVDWSGTGAYISYWGPDADELRVVHDDRVVARLAPTIPRVRWVGDGLVFIEKNTIREWRDGAVRTISVIAPPYVPKYPRDDVYFSGDGTAFTLTRYSQDGTLERYLGTTATGDLVPLDTGDARYIEWAPSGHALLVRDVDRVELRDPDTGTKNVAEARAVHAWAPDGRTLLLGTVSPTVP